MVTIENNCLAFLVFFWYYVFSYIFDTNNVANN